MNYPLWLPYCTNTNRKVFYNDLFQRILKSFTASPMYSYTPCYFCGTDVNMGAARRPANHGTGSPPIHQSLSLESDNPAFPVDSGLCWLTCCCADIYVLHFFSLFIASLQPKSSRNDVGSINIGVINLLMTINEYRSEKPGENKKQ